MASIYTSTDTLITSYVTSVIPSYDVIRTTNRLLSGDWHTQIIGQGARRVAVDFICDLTGKNLIDAADATGDSLRVTSDGKYYIGITEDSPGFSKASHDKYAAQIRLLVSEEGDV